MKKDSMITIKTKDSMVFFSVLGDEYRTNRMGEGLWRWEKTRAWADGEPIYEWKQILGTCQFSLTQKTYSGKRKAIYEHFKEDIDYEKKFR